MPMPYNPNAQYGMPPMPGQYGVPQQPYYPPQPMGAPQQKPGKQVHGFACYCGLEFFSVFVAIRVIFCMVNVSYNALGIQTGSLK